MLSRIDWLAGKVIFVALLCLVAAAPLHAGSISGRVWNDVNRNGIQETGETGIPDIQVVLFDLTVATNLAGSRATDNAGHYLFENITNGIYQLTLYHDQTVIYGISPQHVGNDDTIDSDIDPDTERSPLLHLTNGVNVTIDIGMFLLTRGLSFEIKANQYVHDRPLFVTNGAMVRFDHTLINTGEVALSWLYVYDGLLDDFIFSLDCPFRLSPGEIQSFSNTRQIVASYTNTIALLAMPIHPKTCNQVDLDPFYTTSTSVVIVVTTNPLDFNDGDVYPNWWEIQYGLDPLNSNSPNLNRDGDWMTDWEEYLADTNPTNPASFFPNASLFQRNVLIPQTSTARVYSVWWNTNLLENPQPWTWQPPEQMGSGASLLFPIPNHVTVIHYRTGVRLP